MKRALTIAAAALLASATLPALAQQATGEGEASGTTVIQPGSDTATGEAAGTVGGTVSGDSDMTVTGSIDLSAEDQAELRSVLSGSGSPVELETEVSVGAMLPATVEFQPLPPRFIEVVPEYEGYRYFVLADGRIVIVKPDTPEVVYIMS